MSQTIESFRALEISGRVTISTGQGGLLKLNVTS